MIVTEEKPLDIVSEDALITLPSSPVTTLSKTKKSPPRFSLGLCIYSICLLLLVVGALWLIGINLSRYEGATPTKALNEYLALVKVKNFEALYESSGFQETLLTTKNDYIQYLETLYKGAPASVTVQELLSPVLAQRHYAVCFDEEPVSTVVATAQGDGWIVSTELIYQSTYTLYAAPDMTVAINGNDLSLLYTPQVPVQQTLFSGVSEIDIYPTVMAYTLEGLLTPPRCMAFTLNGTPCTVVSKEQDPYKLYVSDPTITAFMEDFAQSVISDYACFIAGDVKRQTMLDHTYKNSSAYELIAAYDNRQFERHTAYDLGEIEITDSLSFTGSDYSCTAALQPTYSYKGKTFKGDPITCRLTFLKIEEEWLLISLENTIDSSLNNTDTTIQMEESP